MKPSLRLSIVAVVVLTGLLIATAMQVGVRTSEIGAYDRSRLAVHLVEALRDVNAAVTEAGDAASFEPIREQAAAAVTAMDRVTALLPGLGEEVRIRPNWVRMRDGWFAARTPSDLQRLMRPTEATIRNAFLSIAAFALVRGSHEGVDGPLSEAALLAIPAMTMQEAALTAHLEDGAHDGETFEGEPEGVALAERYTGAQTIGSVGFFALKSPAALSGLPPTVPASADAAANASEAFMNALRAAVAANRLPRDRATLAAEGRSATEHLDALETTLLPLLDARLVHSRALAVREIALIAVVVAAVVSIIVVLCVQALRSQWRSFRTRAALEHQARHDSLTGLPNRHAFAAAIGKTVDAWTPINDRTNWVLSIDLDDFKEVNDRYGHQMGDKFLIAAAQRLRDATPADDILARVGGDEFAVLVRQYDPDSSFAVDVAQGMCNALGEPITIDGIGQRLAASVGVVAVDALHETVDSLLRDADIAMYRAKENGGSRVVVFDDTLREEIVYRAELAAQLPAALARGEIGAYFQPIVAFGDDTCHGFEALVRWNHPTHGMIDAGLLIDVAQDARLIKDLGRHVVHDVCRHLARWRDAGVDLASLTVHVNISPLEAVHAETFFSIADALESYAIPHRTLVVELTETAAMDSRDAAGAFLTMLHAIDVRICLDDFGTGYSSLRHLNDFQIDAIKIDRSFVVSAAADPAKVPIIAGIIALGQGLNAEVIAEGIETAHQLAVVAGLGCTLLQGYLFARPLTPDDALEFMQRSVAPVA